MPPNKPTRCRASILAAPETVGYTFTVTGLPSGSILNVFYADTATQGKQDKAQATSGGIGTVQFLANAIVLAPASNGPLNAEITDYLSVSSGPLTGTVTIPSTASVSLTNTNTHQTIQLANGRFSIPTGA